MGTSLDSVTLTHLRGISPIVEKLPINLQEKWLSTGSRYKEHYAVSCPPFSFLADFVNGEAKARNDPSFVLMNDSCSHFCNERPIAKHDGVRMTIPVNKTDLSAAAGSNSMYRAEMGTKNSGDRAKYCPLHNKSHPLEKCRAFKMKTLTERTRLLRDLRWCFRCCSATHMAKDCSVELKCYECESDWHCTAMHPDIHLSPAVSSASEPDTEQQNNTPSEVMSRCTEVCGEGLPARACAKLVLGSSFPTRTKRTLSQDVCHPWRPEQLLMG